MRVKQVVLRLGLISLFFFVLGAPSYSQPRPVRIAIVPASSSGTEQQVVDLLSDQLQGDGNVVVSTVNPDWYVSCRIVDRSDVVSLDVRVNGTVTIKAASDGTIINTISAQANKQDFSVSGPQPLNKALVASATKEVVDELAQRSFAQIEDAVNMEIETREKLLNAHDLAENDKYEDALAVLMTITRDSPHFWPAHNLADQFRLENEALKLIQEAKAEVKAGNYCHATIDLRQVSPKSKRYKLAQSMIASFPHQTLAKNKTAPPASAAAKESAQLKALEAQKKALDAERRAIEAQQRALRSKDKP